MPLVRTVEINAPPETVWRVLTDVDRWPEWTASCNSAKREDDGPLRAGSRALMDMRGGKPAWWRVTSLVEGRSFDWETSSGPGVRVVGGHAIEPTETGSRVRLSITGRGPLGTLLDPLIARMAFVKDNVETEAAGLKDRAEELAK